MTILIVRNGFPKTAKVFVPLRLPSYGRQVLTDFVDQTDDQSPYCVDHIAELVASIQALGGSPVAAVPETPEGSPVCLVRGAVTGGTQLQFTSPPALSAARPNDANISATSEVEMEAASEPTECCSNRPGGTCSPPPRGGDGGGSAADGDQVCEREEDETAASSLGPAHDEEPSLPEDPAEAPISTEGSGACVGEEGEAVQAPTVLVATAAEAAGAAAAAAATSSGDTGETGRVSQQPSLEPPSQVVAEPRAIAPAAADQAQPASPLSSTVAEPASIPSSARTAGILDTPPPLPVAVALPLPQPAELQNLAALATAAVAKDVSSQARSDGTGSRAALRAMSEATLDAATAAAAGTAATSAERSAVRRVSDIEGALTSIKVSSILDTGRRFLHMIC